MTSHDSSGSTDRDRLRRLQALDELLPALAGVLDVADVFERISDVAQKVIPHDMLALPLFSEDKQTVIVHAVFDAKEGDEKASHEATHGRRSSPPSGGRMGSSHRR